METSSVRCTPNMHTYVGANEQCLCGQRMRDVIPFPFITLHGERVTTNSTIARDLQHVLRGRGLHVGETWSDFKLAVERGLGVRDDDVLASIEFGCAQTCTGRIVRDDDEHGVVIKEVR